MQIIDVADGVAADVLRRTDLTGMMHLAGAETVTGVKTFDAGAYGHNGPLTAFAGAWSPTALYQPGDLVVYNGQLYEASNPATALPAPAFVGARIGGTTPSTYSAPLPTGAQAGDLIVAFSVWASANTVPAATWGTRVASGTPTNSSLYTTPAWEIRTYVLTAPDVTAGNLQIPGSNASSGSGQSTALYAFRNAALDTTAAGAYQSQVAGTGNVASASTGSITSAAAAFAVYALFASSSTANPFFGSANNITWAPALPAAQELNDDRGNGVTGAANSALLTAWAAVSNGTAAAETISNAMSGTSNNYWGAQGVVATVKGANTFDASQWTVLGAPQAAVNPAVQTLGTATTGTYVTPPVKVAANTASVGDTWRMTLALTSTGSAQLSVLPKVGPAGTTADTTQGGFTYAAGGSGNGYAELVVTFTVRSLGTAGVLAIMMRLSPTTAFSSTSVSNQNTYVVTGAINTTVDQYLGLAAYCSSSTAMTVADAIAETVRKFSGT